jgi:hypothetical protein
MHVRYLHGFTSFAKTLKSLCLLKGVELDWDHIVQFTEALCD